MSLKKGHWIVVYVGTGLLVLLVLLTATSSGGMKVLNKAGCGVGIADACNAAGVALAEEEDFDGAQDMYQKACDSGDMDGCCNLGLLLNLLEDGEAAETTLNTACQGGSKRACWVLSDWEREFLKERLAVLEADRQKTVAKSDLSPAEEQDEPSIMKPSLAELCRDEDYVACLELCGRLPKVTAEEGRDTAGLEAGIEACKKLISADNEYTAEGIYHSAMAAKLIELNETVVKMFADACRRGFKQACAEEREARLEVLPPDVRRLREAQKRVCTKFVQGVEVSGVVGHIRATSASFFGIDLMYYVDVFRECASADVVDLDIIEFQKKRAKGFRKMMHTFAKMSRDSQIVASKYCGSTAVIREEIRNTPDLVLAIVDLGREVFDRHVSRKKRLKVLEESLHLDFEFDSTQMMSLTELGLISSRAVHKIQAVLAATRPGAPLGEFGPATEAVETYLTLDTRAKPYDTRYDRKKKMLEATAILGAELAYLGWLAAQ